MPRWQPGTRERLERAALELFAERGYGEVTVQDVADRAGVSKATYFRVFVDKREVLFWGQDLLATLLAQGVRAAAPEEPVATLLAAALREVATAFPVERHDLAATREAVVDSAMELQERRAYKRLVLRDSLEGALRARGVSPAVARLAADVGRESFSAAYRRWAADAEPRPFSDYALDELDQLLEAAARLAD